MARDDVRPPAGNGAVTCRAGDERASA